MNYLMLKPKSKREETFLRSLIEKLNIEYKKISIDEYINQIAESKKQFKQGKKISLNSLGNGIRN